MSYLLLSSAYRDRLLYPNPADFVVQFGTINNPNQSQLNVFYSTNPISLTLPDYNFCWTNFATPYDPDYGPFVFETTIVAGTSTAPLLGDNVNTALLGIYRKGDVPPPFALVQQTENAYGILAGWVLVVGNQGSLSIRDILDYDPATRIALLRNPLPDFDVSEGPVQAFLANLSKTTNPQCPTPLTPIFANEQSGSIVFANGFFLERSSNVYFDYAVYLYDITINEVALVQKYQSDLQVFTLCNPFSCAWSVTDQYWVLSRNAPMAIGEIQPIDSEDSHSPFYNVSFLEDYTFLEAGRGYVLGQRVALVADPPDDSSKDPTIAEVVRIDGGGGVVEIRLVRISRYPYRLGTRLVLHAEHPSGHITVPAVVVVRNTSLVFRCTLRGGTFRPQDWEGNYFVSVLASPQYQYDPSTRNVYLSPNATIPARNTANTPIDLLQSQNQWGAAGIRKVVALQDGTVLLYVQNYFQDRLIRFDVLHERLTSLPPYFRGWNHFIITQFSSEGVVPLNYTGSQITQSQMTCHEMAVVNLILPNKIINSPQGLLTSAYPYVFLELSNETMPSGHNRSIIYSNNPSAVRATFVCSISDVNNPQTTRFIKISSDGATQTLKFSPYDNLRVRVTLPSGQPFLTEENDTLVPCEPDPTLQLSMVFQITRL